MFVYNSIPMFQGKSHSDPARPSTPGIHCMGNLAHGTVTIEPFTSIQSPHRIGSNKPPTGLMVVITLSCRALPLRVELLAPDALQFLPMEYFKPDIRNTNPVSIALSTLRWHNRHSATAFAGEAIPIARVSHHLFLPSHH